MEFRNRAAQQDVHSHVGGVGAKLGVVDAAGGEGSGGYEGIRAGVVGDAGLVQGLGDGDFGGHDHVIGGGEDRVHAADHGGGGFYDLAAGVAGLFHKVDLLFLKIRFGFGDGGGGVGFGVGVQQADGLDVGVGGQHHVQNEGGIQRVGGAGDVTKAGEAGGFGVGNGGIHNRNVGAVSGGDHALGGESCDGDDEVNAVAYHLCADLVQHGGVVLAVELLNVDLDALFLGQRLKLGDDGGADLIQRSVIQLLDNGDVEFLYCGGGIGRGFGGRRGSGGGSGGGGFGSAGCLASGEHGEHHHNGQNQRNNLFHNKILLFDSKIIVGWVCGFLLGSPSSAGSVHRYFSFLKVIKKSLFP